MWQWNAGYPFWLDEEMLALNLRGRSFGELAGPLWLDQSAPLGWLALERFVLLAFGTGERALRLPPLLFGLGTLACAVWIGGRWLNAAGAAVLALLCAFGPWLAYHALELKPYSSDAFWGLLLPALAAWAVDARSSAGDGRNAVWRAVIWWGVAAVAQWFGNGALLVAPACAVVLHVSLWRRYGWRIATVPALAGLGWLACFGLHYQLAVQHTVGRALVSRYWSFAMSPEPGSPGATLEWALSTLRPLAEKPVGTTHPLIFWSLVIAGASLAIRSCPGPGALVALIPLSAIAFGSLRLVPVYERLSLWVVPALYVAVAVAAAGAARLGRWAVARRRPVGLLAAGAAVIAIALVALDIVAGGRTFLLLQRADDYHELDDRSGVRWLLRQRRDGDVVLTTRLALPAVWWYGGEWRAPGGPQSVPGTTLPVFEAQLLPENPGCAGPLAAQLGRPSRVLLYLGFRADDWRDEREDLLLTSLAEVGAITQFRPFAARGGAIVFDLEQPPSPGPQLPPRPWVREQGTRARAAGCIVARPALPW